MFRQWEAHLQIPNAYLHQMNRVTGRDGHELWLGDLAQCIRRCSTGATHIPLPPSAYHCPFTSCRQEGGVRRYLALPLSGQMMEVHCRQQVCDYAEKAGEESVLQPVNGKSHGSGEGKRTVPAEHLSKCHAQLGFVLISSCRLSDTYNDQRSCDMECLCWHKFHHQCWLLYLQQFTAEIYTNGVMPA